MPNFRKLKLSSRSFGLSEKTTPRKSWSEFTPFEVYLKIWPSRQVEEEAKKDEWEQRYCDSNGKGRGGRLEEVVSYSYELEARVNFYMEAVSSYDDTTDCSVRWVVYRSTIRQDRDLGPGTTTMMTKRMRLVHFFLH